MQVWSTQMGDEVELSMSLPLDSEGFLRRECPTCEREFKWLSSEEEDTSEVPEGGYFCPYCGVQAPPDSWFTKPQLELAETSVLREVVAPELEKFGKQLDKIGRQSGGFITAELDFEAPEHPDPLTEQDDMKRVDFPCHPREPLKVQEDWNRPVYCLICGSETAS